jgi:hypothetical protein
VSNAKGSQDDFMVFTMAVNRFDLLDVAVESAAPYNLVILDNSDGKLRDRYKNTPHVSLFTPPVPLSFTQSSNVEYRMAAAFGKKYYVHMHSDAQFPSSKIDELLDTARKADADGRKWLVAFSLYDIVCVYSVAAMVDIGGYDSHLFHFYYSDQDAWRRASLAGYERIEAGGDGVVHNGGGSATLHSDIAWQVCNDYTFPLTKSLYISKWGGDVGSEVYQAPFNRSDAFPDLKPLVP